MPLKLSPGDIIELKKKHPCGGRTFEIVRSGMDFRIRCLSCGSQMRLSRPKLEKSVVRSSLPPQDDPKAETDNENGRS